MGGSAVRPRPDQVAALTSGVCLPLPAIEDIHLLVLAEGLCQAFEDLLEHYPATIASGTEPEVTALLEVRLLELRHENPLWRHLVDYVARDKGSISFDGSHLGKSPDLSIVLSGRERRFPLVAEAKILDAGSGKTVSLYCKHGLRRFLDGEYAWGNREAFIIGYVRDGSSVEQRLRPFLSRDTTSNTSRYSTTVFPTDAGLDDLDLAYTRHRRGFVYEAQEPPNTPGEISVWHLWLS